MNKSSFKIAYFHILMIDQHFFQFGPRKKAAKLRFDNTKDSHRCHLQFKGKHFAAAAGRQWQCCNVDERREKHCVH